MSDERETNILFNFKFDSIRVDIGLERREALCWFRNMERQQKSI